jgi:hypothetical protein
MAAYSRLSKVRDDRKLHAEQEKILYKKMLAKPELSTPNVLEKGAENAPEIEIDKVDIKVDNEPKIVVEETKTATEPIEIIDTKDNETLAKQEKPVIGMVEIKEEIKQIAAEIESGNKFQQ